MSSHSKIEKDKAVINVYLLDGSSKSFLVTESQTANAVKFMVCKQLSLDVKEFSNFELYIVDDEKLIQTVTDKPFSIFEKWGNNSNQKFLFKRKDQTYVPFKQIIKPNQQEINNNNSSQTPSSSSQQQVQNTHQNVSQPTQNDPNHSKRVTILSWINRHISTFDMKISNLTNDLADGVVLFRLLESITEKSFKGWNTQPSNMMDKLNNLNMFLKLLYHFGIKISGITCEDIYSGNENISMAIILLLIKKFSKPNDQKPVLKINNKANNQNQSTDNTSSNNNNNVENMNNNSFNTIDQHESHFNTDISSYDDATSSNNENNKGQEVIEEDNLSDHHTTELKPVNSSNIEPIGDNSSSSSSSSTLPPGHVNLIPSFPKKFAKVPPPNSKKGIGKIPPPKKSPIKVIKKQTTPPSSVKMNPNIPLPSVKKEPIKVDTNLPPQPSLEQQLPQSNELVNVYNESNDTNTNIEIDFSPDIPGSNNDVNSSHRRRASTVRHINTNVFDLDAFSDMEDLLKGIAESLDV